MNILQELHIMQAFSCFKFFKIKVCLFEGSSCQCGATTFVVLQHLHFQVLSLFEVLLAFITLATK